MNTKRKRPVKKVIKKVLEIEYHRNGISGIGFYAVRFICEDNNKEMLAMVFNKEQGEESYSGVVCPEEGISSCYRGDWYDEALRRACQRWSNKRHKELMASLSS